MIIFSRAFLIGLFEVLAGLLAVADPAASADLGPGVAQVVKPVPQPSQWQFSFTPYGWMTSVNGNTTAAGHTVDIDASFFDIVEKSDSIMALMGYFEARKGRFGFFTDVVWEDLSFDVHRDVSRNPFARFPNVNVAIEGNAQLDYQSTIIQSGIAYELARWPVGGGAYPALDVVGSARYWNQEVDVSLKLTGTVTAELQRLGLKLQRSGSLAVARSGDLEWVDPVVGARLRHQMISGAELTLYGDVGGFGVGSDFSWQAVATYAFDVNCFGTPLRTVVGYRALAVDYSENGRFGRNNLDFVQHGPVMGVSFRW